MSKKPADAAYAYPLIVKQLLHSCMLTSPDQEIVSGDFRYDYKALNIRLAKLAQGLESLGVKFGDTVAVMNWDCHRYLECFLAVPMMGAILHTINIRLSAEQLLYTINHAEDDFILVHSDFLPLLRQIQPRIEGTVKLILISEPNCALPADFETDYDTLLSAQSGEYEFADFDESTIATTFYTTGTTGDPKGVFYSHRQLVIHTMGMLCGLSPLPHEVRFHNNDVYMPMTPMFHVHAWGMPYAATMLGLKQVYPGRYEPAKLVHNITTEKVTFSHCVPTIMNMLLSCPEAESADLSALKVIIGGSALPQGLSQTCVEKGIQVFAAYGMSETCPFLTVANTSEIDHLSTADSDVSARGKTGRPVAMVDLRVVDNEMRDIPRGGNTTGEVVVRTPWLTQGYTSNPDGSEALWSGGYMHTGDVGYIDEDGSLMITDRMKDIIKSGGEWLSSLELENIVSRCECVAEVAAIGIPDAKWGERPLLVAALAKESDPAESINLIRQSVVDAVEQGMLPKWAIPERIEIVESIDKTSVGKLDKKVLRARYA